MACGAGRGVPRVGSSAQVGVGVGAHSSRLAVRGLTRGSWVGFCPGAPGVPGAGSVPGAGPVLGAGSGARAAHFRRTRCLREDGGGEEVEVETEPPEATLGGPVRAGLGAAGRMGRLVSPTEQWPGVTSPRASPSPPRTCPAPPALPTRPPPAEFSPPHAELHTCPPPLSPPSCALPAS